MENRLNELNNEWRPVYRKSSIEMTGDDDARGYTCWIFANAALKVLTGDNDPQIVKSKKMYDKNNIDAFINELKTEVANQRVIMISYSDPEMHDFVILHAFGDKLYFVDNRGIESGHPRIEMYTISEFMIRLMGVIKGEEKDYFYDMYAYQTKPDPETNNPLYEWRSYNVF